jgi:hypothetical protein
MLGQEVDEWGYGVQAESVVREVDSVELREREEGGDEVR